MSRLGIVADDLTGGTTVGALIAREGSRPTVLFRHHGIAEAVTGDEDTIIVSTDSRAMEPEVAFGRVRHAAEQLLALGAEQLSKRIDTTLRGGVGPEVEGMMSALEDAGEDPTAIIVPAMPQSRRIVVGGYSLIDSVPLAETDVARDVRTPVTESHLPTLLSRQFSREVAHVGLADVLAGQAALRARFARLHESGVRAIVLDAATIEHVDEIARAVVAVGGCVVAVDPGPFSVRLAAHRGLLAGAESVERPLRTAPSAEAEHGTIAVVAGSASARTHEQMTRLAAEPGTQVLTADVLRLIGDEASFEVEAARVRGKLRGLLDGPETVRVALLALDTVISGGRTAKADLEAASGLTGHRISTLLTHRFGRLARLVLDEIGREHLAGAYLTGGDVMVATCQALEADGLAMVDYVIPQVDQAGIVGGPYAHLPVVCKGGLTGTEVTALQSVNRLFDERTLSS
ncbi:four-carbon acid sugar kinase family protein [Brachybacterium kimchii]|uniref:Four-carbon acid sugar kinase family protein n=1 Tax=Brachybacterium kimchii TaxID=2942909 RepID=A0ABY4N2J3_9MICO|nr:four-carbon acid sugar kinase family protein [Brachybacterium kimchii]UQN28767.1 four-carbon acid sugar kinase family protein [Brachybacterium kimchii]